MTPVENLARLRDGRRYSRRDEQPVRLKVDSGVSLEVPGPRLLAATFTLPWLAQTSEVYSLGGAILTRAIGSLDEPKAVDQASLAADVAALLRQLPPRPDAGRPYRDLSLFITEASPSRVNAYLTDVTRSTRALAPRWRPARPASERRAPLTPAQRKAAQRTRNRAAEVASARWWLQAAIDEGTDELDGPRIVAADLYEHAREVIAEYADDQEPIDPEDENSLTFRVPGPRTFYAVADEVLGPRRRGTNGTLIYVVPELTPETSERKDQRD